MVDLGVPEPDACVSQSTRCGGWQGDREMVLRRIATRGTRPAVPRPCFVIGSALAPAIAEQRERFVGIRVLALDRGFNGAQVAAEPWLLVGAKTLSYAVNIATYRYAKANDADDVIFVGSDGAVLEAPTSTVILVRGRTLVTPPREGILDGITGRRLFRVAAEAGWETAIETVMPDDLHTADGLWLASSVQAADADRRRRWKATSNGDVPTSWPVSWTCRGRVRPDRGRTPYLRFDLSRFQPELRCSWPLPPANRCPRVTVTHEQPISGSQGVRRVR